MMECCQSRIIQETKQNLDTMLLFIYFLFLQVIVKNRGNKRERPQFPFWPEDDAYYENTRGGIHAQML